MPRLTARRWTRRLVGGMLAGALSVGTVGLATPAHADDDYPYSGMGQCPLTPPDPPTVLPDGTEVPAPPQPLTCARRIWMVAGTYADPWGFALRNCTSFVAWRLRETNGVGDFRNYMDGGHWGDARHWDDNAEKLGYVVDSVPAVGAIAQTDKGTTGHVAWVKAVDGDSVAIEEYNHFLPGGYGWRIVPASDFRYIHVDDLESPPMLGSARAAAVLDDAEGRTWSARVRPGGDLIVDRPDGRTVRMGLPGAWSPQASPTLTLDAHGRVWLAAVSADGRVFVRHTQGRADRFSDLHALDASVWSTASTPALALDREGRMRVFAVTAWGDLFEMHTSDDRARSWSPPRALGAEHHYAAQSSPAVAVEESGRVRVVMVTGKGRMEQVRTGPDGLTWADPTVLAGASWSITASPTLTRGAGERWWLHAVTDRGRLLALPSRTRGQAAGFGPARSLGRGWSPYAGPSVTRDVRGALWVAAVRSDGKVVLVGDDRAPRRWRGARALDSGMTSITAGPVVSAHADGVTVRARAVDGPAIDWRVAPATERPGSASSSRAARHHRLLDYAP